MLSALTSDLTNRCLNRTHIGKLFIGCGISLVALGCTASPVGSKPVIVPDDIRSFVAPADTLLAYKTADLYGDGSWAAVIVVRHKAGDMSDYDFDHNPCDLLVLRRESGKLLEVDHSSKAVDCTYNDLQRRAPTMSLNSNLEVSPASIVFINQKSLGNSTFHFAWSKPKDTWFLCRAAATNVQNGVDINAVSVTDVNATYPKNFGWIPMSSVDPDAIAEILNKLAK